MMPSPPSPSGDPNRDGVDAAGLLRRLAAGAKLEDLLNESPELKPDDLRACFAYAAEVLDKAAPFPAKNEMLEWTATNAAEPATLPPPSAVDEAVTLAPNVDVTPSTASKRISLPGYEILGKLGEGGMGVVYKARHLRLNRIVAIKMILAGEHASEAMLARFAVEAEAVAQLQHPGIVQIHEIGEHDGHSFLALEYVAGGSLAARLDDKPWPADKAAELVETLARTMQVAHDHGIVHRDLKPENVLLADAATEADGKPTPKITDFGLAKRLQETTGRTRTGEIMGTPSYMAPEQAAGKKDIGPAADIYSLGAILYRLLTGRPPFQADTPLDTIMLVLEQEPVSLRALNKKLPRDLETMALKCLAKEPAKRYASAEELADDLRRFLDGEPIKARRLSPHQRLFRWCRKRPGAAFARGLLPLLLLPILLLMMLIPIAGFRASEEKWAGLMILGWVFSAVFFCAAITRTRLRPFLIGLANTLVLATVSSIAFVLRVPLFDTLQTGNWFPLKYLFPGFTAESLTTLACLLPLLLGLSCGLFSSWGKRTLSCCLVPFLLLVALEWSEICMFLASALAFSLYFGVLCRFVRWWNDGNLIDTIVGSLWGTIIGLLISAFIFAILNVTLFWNDSDLRLNAVIASYILGSIVGSFVGACFGAIVGKRTTRRGHA